MELNVRPPRFRRRGTSEWGQQPDSGGGMGLGLASLALVGLGIVGPGIASGLVAGAPQLGAGAAIGTALGAGGIMYLGGTGAIGAARGLAIGSASCRARGCQSG